MASSPHGSDVPASVARNQHGNATAPPPLQINNNNTHDSHSNKSHKPNHDDDLIQNLNNLSIASAGSVSADASPRSLSPRKSSLTPSSPSSNGRGRTPPHHTPRSPKIDTSSAQKDKLLRKSSMNSLRAVSLSGSPRRASGHFAAVEKEVERPPPPTAEQIASAFFKKDWEAHETDREITGDTIAVIHDACYGHRFSRPRTSKAALSTIVERPERVHASILGLAAAYVRLGHRHAQGKHAPHPATDAASLPSIPFRIRKSSRRVPLNSPAVTNVHGVKWMEELRIMCETAEKKLATNGKELVRPDVQRDPENDPPAKFHEGDLYLCSESLEAMEGALGAVCDGVDAVFEGSKSAKGPHKAFVTIRPPGHHCSASFPSGFCWINNVHVGISHAALNHGLTHSVIIDFDLHHGDGSQAIAWEHNTRAFNAHKKDAAWKKTHIAYYSIHDINSYPCEMGDEEKVKNASLCLENAHGQNIWNVHLQPWKTTAEFWELYETRYKVLLDKARTFLYHEKERLSALPGAPKPKAAIFLSAGFDASEWESAGMQRHKVNVPTEFYARLAQDVTALANEEGNGVEGRIISVLEGGYSDRALTSGTLSHVSGLAGLATNLIKTESGGNEQGFATATKSHSNSRATVFDTDWWAAVELDKLEVISNQPPPPPPVEPKKTKNINPPNYSTPTQSFTAKTVGAAQLPRSPSGSLSPSPKPVRPPTPPPPEIEWTVAACEFRRVLVPSDRQTKSCRPEDLGAEATRARRDRQSLLTPPATEVTQNPLSTTRMSLRERKPVKAVEDTPIDSAAKTRRRRTVADGIVLASEADIAGDAALKAEPGFAQPTKQSTRRLSLSSNAGSTTSTTKSTTSRVPAAPATSARSASAQGVKFGQPSTIPPNPAAVRKARTPTAPKPPAVKTARVKKQPPALDKSDEVSFNVDRKEKTPESKKMESLTSNFGKIKINLVTQAQRDAKEKARLADLAAAESSKAKETATDGQTNDSVAPTPEPELPTLPSEPIQEEQRSTIGSAPTTSAPTTPGTESVTALSPILPGHDNFIPYEPKATAAEITAPSMSTNPQLQWLPPNTGTPAVQRNTLPVFTATSPIPFAVPNAPSGLANAQIPSITQVPKFSSAQLDAFGNLRATEAPLDLSSPVDSEGHASLPPNNGSGHVVPQFVQPEQGLMGYDQGGAQYAGESWTYQQHIAPNSFPNDEWEVPETPQK